MEGVEDVTSSGGRDKGAETGGRDVAEQVQTGGGGDGDDLEVWFPLKAGDIRAEDLAAGKVVLVQGGSSKLFNLHTGLSVIFAKVWKGER